MTNLQLPPLALYIHVPWCIRKCPYCDFNSHVTKEGLLEAEYVDALIEDMRWEQSHVGDRTVQSIFFGGGTPSLFSDAAIARILDAAAKHFSFADDIEITLEANPGTAEAGHFRGYFQAGVNRLSMGVQSLNDGHLKSLGRIHNAAEALAAYGMARAAGFENINLDLMYGLPKQSIDEAEAEVEALCGWRPEHISHYQLTLEPDTAFFHRPPPLPTDDALWDMQQRCQSALARHGYEQYEVSAYGRVGQQCRHNQIYWRFGDYLGIGAGAHGKISSLDASSIGGLRIDRRSRQRLPGRYLAADAEGRLDEQRTLDSSDRLFEFAVNALRLRDGFSRNDFVTTTGLPVDELNSVFAEGKEKDWLREADGQIKATETGYRYLNDVLLLFSE